MAKPQPGRVDVVVVGSIGLDTVQTPAERRSDLLGGSVSYACAAASFFSRVGMVGVVGSDFPDEHVRTYERFGIDLRGLQREKGRTFRWSGVYEADMINRRTLTTELNVFEDFRPVLPPPYREARIVLLGNISPDLQCSVLDQAKAPDLVIADTMDLWINRTRTRLLEVIERSNVLMLNDGEARLLTGSSGVRDCAATILKWGPQYVVIKKGEHGALLFSRQGIFVVPAFPVPAVRDPTGAGDAFAGGFAGAIARFGPLTGDSIRHALLVGSAVASFSVQEFSLEGLKGIGLQDIGARLAEMKRMMSAGQEPEQWIGAP